MTAEKEKEAPKTRRTTLEDLVQAQSRIYDLRQRGTAPPSQEMKVAMNRFMSLLRHAGPEEVAAFDRWRKEEESRRGLR
ncbi:MAG: hypothetical protein HY685_01980 [Chloroflexi bacterium]|nr:hypothetical protein [Chloroflexota bacterium]